MTLDDYQKGAMKTEIMARSNELNANEPALIAKILGLLGESGEVAEKFKKIVRDKGGVISPEDVADLQKELGDVLWYVSVLADYVGLSLEEVAQMNLDKLASRQKRGKLAGSGDNR